MNATRKAWQIPVVVALAAAAAWAAASSLWLPGLFLLGVAALLLAWGAEFPMPENWASPRRRDEHHFHEYFDHAPVGMATTSPEKGWVEVNDTLCRMFGYSREELLAMSWAELTHPDDLAADLVQFDRLLLGEIEAYDMEKRFLRRDGSVVHTHLAVRAIREDGRLDRIIALLRDISQRARMEERLRVQTRLYALLSKTGEAMLQVADEKGLFQVVCDIACRDGGFAGAWVGVINPQSWKVDRMASAAANPGALTFISSLDLSIDPAHPGSRGPTGTALRGNAPYVCNDYASDLLTLPWRELADVWHVAASGSFPLHRSGVLVGALSLYADTPGFFDAEMVALLSQLAADISFALDRYEAEHRRAEAEAALKRSAELLEATVRARTAQLNAANVALEQRAQLFERRAEQYARLAELTDLLQSCQDMAEARATVGRALPGLFPSSAGALFRRNGERLTVETAWGAGAAQARDFNGDDCWALRRGKLHLVAPDYPAPHCAHLDMDVGAYVCAPIQVQGRPQDILHVVFGDASEEERQGVLQLAKDLADRLGLAFANIELRESLRYQSLHDPLTGVYNRRFMEESLERELHRAARSHSQLSVIMVDIDWFKRVNDSFGHEAGDVVLKRVAQELHREVRQGDVVCRYGGEEFVIILPGLGVARAQERAEALRVAVERLDLAAATGSARPMPQGISISLGVAGWPEHAEDVGALLASADRALYRAKELGRNRVVVAAPAVPCMAD